MDRKTPKILVAAQFAVDKSAIERGLSFIGACQFVSDGWSCLRLVGESQYDLVIVLSELMNFKGLDVVRALRRDPKHSRLPVIFVVDPKEVVPSGPADPMLVVIRGHSLDVAKLIAAVTRLLSINAERAWQSLPESPRVFLESSRRLFETLVSNYGRVTTEDLGLLETAAGSLVTSIGAGQASLLLAVLDRHDDYTFVHNLRVAALLVAFGVAIKVSTGDLQVLAQAGMLHDIGKLAIPQGILVKPTALTEEEWKVMRLHPSTGAKILREVGVPKLVYLAAERHHERLDGTGYPRGLKAAELDEVSMITAVADVFSALTDRRSYKKALPAGAAFEILRGMCGTHLESGFVERFIGVFERLDLKEVAPVRAASR